MSKNTLKFALILLMVLTLCTCDNIGSKGEDCPEPLADISGYWNITETATTNSCDEGLKSPYTLMVAQSGKDLTIFNEAQSRTFVGKICGAAILWKGSYNEDGGTIELNPVEAELKAGVIQGNLHWKWDDGFDSCSGTTQFTGTTP